MIGEVVGHEHMGRAMSVNVGANNASRMLGPIGGGLLLASTGISGALTVSMLCYAVALAAAIRIIYHNTPITDASRGVLTRIIEGLVLVRNDPKLIGILTITVIYNAFGGPLTLMIPVIGQDNLHLGASGIGILASMDGIGAFCGSIGLALWAKPAHYARLYVGGVMLYLVLLIVFALVPNVPFAGTALLLTGVCNSAFSVMHATLIYLVAPPEMRSAFTTSCPCASARRRSGFFVSGCWPMRSAPHPPPRHRAFSVFWCFWPHTAGGATWVPDRPRHRPPLCKSLFFGDDTRHCTRYCHNGLSGSPNARRLRHLSRRVAARHRGPIIDERFAADVSLIAADVSDRVRVGVRGVRRTRS
jgi:hypothetical protein